MWIQRVYLTIVLSLHFIIRTVGFENLSPWGSLLGVFLVTEEQRQNRKQIYKHSTLFLLNHSGLSFTSGSFSDHARVSVQAQSGHSNALRQFYFCLRCSYNLVKGQIMSVSWCSNTGTGTSLALFKKKHLFISSYAQLKEIKTAESGSDKSLWNITRGDNWVNSHELQKEHGFFYFFQQGPVTVAHLLFPTFNTWRAPFSPSD